MIKKLYCIFIFVLSLTSFLEAKVLLITHACNRPDFIEIQCKTFQKLLLDDYEFVVFNDAPPGPMHDQIVTMCKKWEIQCIPVPQEIHTRPYLPREPNDPLHRPNIRHCNCIQYSLDTLGFNHDGIVGIIDSDIFLVRQLNLESYFEEAEIVAAIRGAGPTIKYLWPGLTFLAMHKLPNKESLTFNCGKIGSEIVDSGGHSYYYLTNNPEVRWRVIDELFSYQLFCPDRFAPYTDERASPEEQLEKFVEFGFNKKEIKFLQQKPHTINFAMDNHFLHYRAGTNYDNQSAGYEQRKSLLINEFIDDVLSDYF